MGNCCNSNISNIKSDMAIKLPHTTEYISYDDTTKNFVKYPDINTWIQNHYCVSHWPNWVVYNDDIHKIAIKPTTSHGHCKGILTWNNERIGWMVHSVPNFPRNFKNNRMSMVEQGELIYAQSFQYIEIPFTDMMLNNILHHINYMDSNIYLENYTEDFMRYKNMIYPTINKCMTLKLTEDFVHIAKPHIVKIDIYADYLVKNSHEKWYVQTWKRGHHINTINMKINDITQMKFEDTKWSSSQDHSKWGVSTSEYYWVGDLNRMTSQYNRGGGGFICRNPDIVKCLTKLIVLD